MLMLLELTIVGIWAAMLVIHTRRLFRLARVEIRAGQLRPLLRHNLNRMWWWLGREEYWRVVQRDGAQALQLTVMVLLIGVGILQ